MLVSVCIPAYEYPDLLDRCLSSVLSQTYTNFEVIITDDSRHQLLQEVVNKYKDPRIRYYHNPVSLGSPANWNKSIDYACGEYIKILHHDDWFFDEHSLFKFVNEIENQKVDFIFSSCINNFKYKDKKHYTTDFYLKKITIEPKTIIFCNDIGAPSTTFFKKEIAKAVCFDVESKWYVDIIFYVQLLSLGFSCGYIKQPLVCITSESPNQITHSTSGLHKVNEAFYTFNMFKLLEKNISSLTKLHIVELLKRYNVKDLNKITAIENSKKERIVNLLKFSSLPFSYKLFALIRVILIKYSPLQLSFKN